MKRISLNEAPKVPFDLEGYIMHKSVSLEVIHLCLKPGQQVIQHANSFDVLTCLMEGEVSLEMGDNSTLLNPYDVVEIEKDAMRGFTNTGTNEARLLIIKKM